MPEKTYTLAELITNLRSSEGLLSDLKVSKRDATTGVVLALGYPITEAGFAQFDADLTAAGL